MTGWVVASGSIIEGSGFTMSHSAGSAYYVVHFPPGTFSSTTTYPAGVVTPATYEAADAITSGAGIASDGSGELQIQTYVNGTATDVGFTFMAFQPGVSSATRPPAGARVTVRWRHGVRQTIERAPAPR